MLAKAEVLWTRQCPIRCSYCSMATGQRNSRSLREWELGMFNLKKLDTLIVIFFGAEPLYVDFDMLPSVIKYAESIGIHTTIITSGIVTHLKEKLQTLYDNGLRSLSVSYDMVDLNTGSKQKSSVAEKALRYFKSLGEIRDLAAIATLTKTNFRFLPTMIKRMSDKGIWTLFDPLHLDRQFPNTKCSSEGNTKSLMLTREDVPELKEIFKRVFDLKMEGYLVHASYNYLGDILTNCDGMIGEYNWKCATDEVFPSWVTIDCDGTVYCCDDNHPSSPFDMTTLYNNWSNFKTFWKEYVTNNCPGCAWNNYAESHLVAKGLVPKQDFIHKGGIV